MPKTTKIRDGQRALFFVFVHAIGKNSCYEMLQAVTRCESLRDSRLTPGMMGDVLSELLIAHPNALDGSNSHQINQGNKRIQLITKDKKEAIQNLRATAKIKPLDYQKLCREHIGLDEPMTDEQADKIIEVLSERVKAKYQKRRNEVWQRMQIV
jgi:hypothetical protein